MTGIDDTVSVSCQKPRRLHEHGNVSVPVWSSEQAEPADAGQWDAGGSIWTTLLSSDGLTRGEGRGGHISKDLTISVLYMFLNRNSF